MRAHEILGYIDLERISKELLRQLEDVFERDFKCPIDLAVLGLMYGQATADVELAQARADLAKTRAESEKLRTAAAKDRGYLR